MGATDSLDLARALLRFDTVNPPGQEADCARFLAQWLEAAGLGCDLLPFAPGRANLVARLPGRDADLAPLVLTGHLDTVPLGDAAWGRDPFAGEIAGDRLFGRGASDMKAGVAAMAVAAMAAAGRPRPRRGLTLVFTGGEEVGCEGARHLCGGDAARLGAASAMIVGEPTANQAVRGHKGALFVRAVAQGRTAHSSMPHLGVNAIYRAARGVGRIEALDLGPAADAFVGPPTVNVGVIRGGLNANSVPDHAEFTIDVRSGAEPGPELILARLRAVLGDEVAAEPYCVMPAVVTPGEDPFLRTVAARAAAVLDEAAEAAAAATYFSDASLLQPRFGCPTVILGPGDPDQAHQVDESCRVDRIAQAQAIYEGVIADWCG